MYPPDCNICGETMFECFAEGDKYKKHVCDPIKIEAYVESLKAREQLANRSMHNIQNAVKYVLLSTVKHYPYKSANRRYAEDDVKEVKVDAEFLRKLWDAADLRYNQSEMDFLSEWLAMHRILCEAFDIFQSKQNGMGETEIRDKLNRLREAVVRASNFLYEYDPDEKFDLSVEDVMIKCRDAS